MVAPNFPGPSRDDNRPPPMSDHRSCCCCRRGTVSLPLVAAAGCGSSAWLRACPSARPPDHPPSLVCRRWRLLARGGDGAPLPLTPPATSLRVAGVPPALWGEGRLYTVDAGSTGRGECVGVAGDSLPPSFPRPCPLPRRGARLLVILLSFPLSAHPLPPLGERCTGYGCGGRRGRGFEFGCVAKWHASGERRQVAILEVILGAPEPQASLPPRPPSPLLTGSPYTLRVHGRGCRQ